MQLHIPAKDLEAYRPALVIYGLSKYIGTTIHYYLTIS